MNCLNTTDKESACVLAVCSEVLQLELLQVAKLTFMKVGDLRQARKYCNQTSCLLRKMRYISGGELSSA